MPFSPYLALAAVLALLGAYMGGNLHGHRAERAVWRLVQAQERAEASRIQAQAEKAAREAQERVETANRAIEEEHAKAIADAAASRDDFERRLRDATRSRLCDPVPASPPTPGDRADATPGGWDGFREPDFDAGRRLREAGLVLQAYAKACHSWAEQVGR